MAGGLFDKALATWAAVFGAAEYSNGELLAMIDDERNECAIVQQDNIKLRWELRCARSIIEARDAEIAALRQQLAERNGDTVRQQYTDVNAWQEATGDMVQ